MSSNRTTYMVRVTPWDHGYELHVEGVGVTQVTDLTEAEGTARDFISLERDVPADSFDLTISGGAA